MVLRPPLLRPMACAEPLFARPSAMLMGAHDGGIDHRVFVVRILGQMLEDPLPHATSGPAAKPRVDHTEVRKPLRKVAPRYPRTISIQHGFHK